ncbi:MAG: hypothetical protein A2036_03715 [Omnitrophica bacterium GWA2_50_21]|nr:MAG: hypothetical protein A2036_03715 [Omnitrophica bacterium GWA2_50_21]
MKLLVIRNPVAGGIWRSAKFHEIEKVLQSEAIPFDIKDTRKSGDATAFAAEACRSGYTHVLVFGGDGTIREAAQAVAGTKVILVPIPTGTANLLAHELNLKADLQKLSRLLKHGMVRYIDLGQVDSESNGGHKHYFALMAGIGMDAVAVQGVDPALKRWLGWGLYIFSGFWHVSGHRPFKTTLRFLDPSAETVTIPKTWVIVIGNARAYGLKGIRVTTRAKMDDGLLDICVFQSRSLWHFIGHFFKVLAGKHLEDQDVLYFQTRSLRVETERKIPVQLDGDLWGKTPLTISAAPKILAVLLLTSEDEAQEKFC